MEKLKIHGLNALKAVIIYSKNLYLVKLIFIHLEFSLGTDAYSMAARLEEFFEKRNNSLFYIVLYLSPSDYHRFHSPTTFICKFRAHIPGFLHPVRPSYLKRHKVRNLLK